jgi:hypothetical protein
MTFTNPNQALIKVTRSVITVLRTVIIVGVVPGPA